MADSFHKRGVARHLVIEKTESRRIAINQGHTVLESVDDRMIAFMRLTLAVSALLIIYIDPSEPDRFVIPTYLALVVYAAYSAVVYLLSVYRHPLPNSVAPWIDVGCYLGLVSLSAGTNSIFFFFFFFAILVASFRGGFKQGISVTVAASVLFTIIGYATALRSEQFELNRFLLRPVYLLALGYLMAYWGGREIKLKRRLSLLREIIDLSNPRFGVGYTIGSMLQKVQSFYDADACLLLLIDPVYKDTFLFRFERGQAADAVRAERIPTKFEELLLSFPEDVAIIQSSRTSQSIFQRRHYYAFDLTKQKKYPGEWQAAADSVASKLDLEAFVSVPLKYRGKPIGRFYLTASRRHFGVPDIDFLMQVAEQIMPVIHNIRLLAQRALSAAEDERRRLARDLHDSVIQPYIGLQYKLAAVRNKQRQGEDTTPDVDRLFRMTVEEVSTLRGFVRGLREGKDSEANLMSALRRFANHFSESYDLDVEVESKGEVEVSDGLAMQLVRIVQEGLSNVRKHTDAARCKITVERSDAILRLSIENDNPRQNGDGPADFNPRSIAERAEDLGGHVFVEQSPDGRAAVRVEIPV